MPCRTHIPAPATVASRLASRLRRLGRPDPRIRNISALTLVLAVVAAGIGLPTLAGANSVPTNPAQFYYVDATWANPVVVNGLLETYAYQQGYAASEGSPDSVIVLDFGRQCDHAPGSTPTAWGVALPGPQLNCSNSYQSDQWVIDRASEFEAGYSAGHTSASIIVVGTNNDDDAVGCPANSAAGTPDPLWQVAWGQNVATVAANEPSMVYTNGGDDIEAWADGGPYPTPLTWVACGPGTENWLSGYETPTSLLMYDYGSQTNSENSAYWSVQQLYDVSFGQPPALSLPEIYYCNKADQWVQFREELNATPTPPIYRFDGVLSSNGSATGCPDGSTLLRWDASWNVLNLGLINPTPTETPFTNDLLSDSTAYNLATPTMGPSPTPSPTPTP
jgi:hypothetical protein